MGNVLALHPAALGLILSITKDFSLDVAAQNSGHRLDNVNQTHLVLAKGKLVLSQVLLYLTKGRNSGLNYFG